MSIKLKQNIRVLGSKLFVNKTEAEHKGVGGASYLSIKLKQNIRVLGGKLFVNKTEAEHKGVGGQVICQ